MKPAGKWAWITLAGCCVLLFIIGGAMVSCMSLYVVPVTEDLGIDRGKFNLLFSMQSLLSMLLSLFAFKVFRIFKLRTAVLIGGLSGACAYILFSIARSLPLFLIGGALIGIALGLCIMPSQIVLTNWFEKKTGFVISLATSFTGIGVLASSPVIGWMISNLGWQRSFFVTGIVGIVSTVLLFLFIIRDRPGDRGCLPYGADEAAAVNDGKTIDAEPSGMSSKEALRSYKFWLVAVCVFVMGLNSMVMVSQQSAMMMDKGLALTVVSGILSVYALFNTFIKIVAGVGIEKLGFRTVAIAAGSLQIIAFLVMLFGQGYVAMVIYAALFGASLCVGLNYAVLTIPMLFGKKALGDLNGFALFAYYLGCFVGPIISGFFFDTAGNYNVTLYIMIILLIVFIAATFIILRKRSLYKS